MVPAPWYKKKKFWVAIITAAGSVTATITGNEKVAQDIVMIGLALIGAIGLEDFGKAKTSDNGNLS